MLVRPETQEDYSVIAAVHRAAFGGDEEARLVERLRRDGLIIASLVAEDDEEVVGHILFSPVWIATAGEGVVLASLAPMAVWPTLQRRGIGSALIAAGLDACRHAGYTAAIVVGHRDYYPRFGFSHALVTNLRNPYAEDDAFMGVELVPGALSGISGSVVYPDAFNELS